MSTFIQAGNTIEEVIPEQRITFTKEDMKNRRANLLAELEGVNFQIQELQAQKRKVQEQLQALNNLAL